MFKGGMASMMQKAQKMQAAMQDAKAEIQNLTAVGKASGNVVSISVNGKYQVTDVKIDASVLADKDLLEDLILSAMNDATGQINALSSAKMQQATGGMNLPI